MEGETFYNAQLWKSLLRHTCTECLWEGERQGHHVTVWGNVPTRERPPTPEPSEGAAD